jgi:hypothetical protein
MALLPYLQCYTPPGHISYQVIQQAGRTLSSRNRLERAVRIGIYALGVMERVQ